MVGLCVIKHALGWVSCQNHPIVALSQHRPKSPGATGQIQYQPRLTGHLERTPDQTPLAPLRPPTHHALRAHLLAHLRMLTVIAFGELKLNGGRWLR